MKRWLPVFGERRGRKRSCGAISSIRRDHSWLMLFFLAFTLGLSQSCWFFWNSHWIDLLPPYPHHSPTYKSLVLMKLCNYVWHDWLEFFKWPFWCCFFFFPLESYKESVYMNRFEKQSFLMSTLSQRFVCLPYLFKMNKNYVTYFHNTLTFLKHFSIC